MFDKLMTEYGYTRSQFDYCVYFCKPLDDFFIYLLLYVDEMLIISKKKMKIDKLKAQLRNEFVKNLAEAKKILGMEIQRDGKKKA
jgi:hypothetical protein